MKKSAYYSDIVFAFFIASIALLCLLRYLKVGLALACLFAVLSGVAASLLTAIFLGRKRELSLTKAKDEKLKEKFLLHLTLLPQKQLSEIICALFECENAGEFYTQGQTLILPLFRLQEIYPDCLLPLFRENGYTQKKILCNAISPEAKKLCEQLGVEVIDGVAIFQLTKEYGLLPSEYVSEPIFAQKKKERWKICFAKSNSRRFLFSGILLLLSSLITPFPYYYLVFGFLLLIAAVFTRIFGAR